MSDEDFMKIMETYGQLDYSNEELDQIISLNYSYEDLPQEEDKNNTDNAEKSAFEWRFLLALLYIPITIYINIIL